MRYNAHLLLSQIKLRLKSLLVRGRGSRQIGHPTTMTRTGRSRLDAAMDGRVSDGLVLPEPRMARGDLVHCPAV
ncbi:hypothetical protein [Desulfosporosinus metallidurans]|uniref:hypothetical protein n=1 Tax=Desulfosporosinus metallidurans TaxID=1888891 RepID=UPI0011153FAC|nr:hypothetical protein [Desulfosporosinus metallidurans]